VRRNLLRFVWHKPNCLLPPLAELDKCLKHCLDKTLTIIPLYKGRDEMCATLYDLIAPGSSLGSVDGDVTRTLRPVLMFLHSRLKEKHLAFCDECCLLVLLMYVTFVVLAPIYTVAQLMELVRVMGLSTIRTKCKL